MKCRCKVFHCTHISSVPLTQPSNPDWAEVEAQNFGIANFQSTLILVTYLIITAMIGPSLPPHLQNRKRETPSDTPEQSSPSSERSPPPKPVVTGPQLPPHLLAARQAKRKREEDDSEHKTESVGPSLPTKRVHPAEPSRTTTPPPLESESDDEGVGPSVSVMMTAEEAAEHARQQAIERLSRATPDHSTKQDAEPKIQRDSWMLAPPTREDWLGRLDASKLKARTFNQSKSGTNVPGKPVDHAAWTESPADKARRLEDEAMGRRTTKHVTESQESEMDEKKRKVEVEEREKRIREYNVQKRGPSLMERHTASKKIEDEDDPTKRPFDYQKDIVRGTTGFKERQAMMNKAKDLNSKYSGGSYL